MDSPLARRARKAKSSSKDALVTPPKGTKDKDVELEFEQLVLALGLPESSREQMVRDLSINQKWGYLAQHFRNVANSGKVKKSPNKIKMTAEYFVAALQQAEIEIEFLSSLRACLATESMELFVEPFLRKEGPKLLLNRITEAEKSTNVLLLRELIRTILALMRTKRGLHAALSGNDSLKRIVLCIRGVGALGDQQTNIYLFDFLAVLLADEPHFFNPVLEAFQYFKLVKHETVLFYTLATVLRDETSLPVKVSVMRCINALCSTSDDLDERMSVRTAFKRLGLSSIVETIYENAPLSEEFALERQAFLDDAEVTRFIFLI